MCPSADSRALTGPANSNARAPHGLSDFPALSVVFITAAPTRRRRWRSTISAEGRGIQSAHKSFALPLLSISRHMAFLQRGAPHALVGGPAAKAQPAHRHPRPLPQVRRHGMSPRSAGSRAPGDPCGGAGPCCRGRCCAGTRGPAAGTGTGTGTGRERERERGLAAGAGSAASA